MAASSVDFENVGLMPAEEDDDDDDSEGWSEMDVENDSTLTCLFCPKPFKTMAVALEHWRTDHGFDLIALKRKFSMDCYSYICLVNYIRQLSPRPQDVAESVTPVWVQEQYLVPTLPEDPWLMFDFEGLESPLDSRAVSPEPGHIVKRENGLVTITDQSYTHLMQTIKRLRAQVEEQEGALNLATEQMQTMRKVTQNLVSGGDACSEVEKSVGLLRITEDHSYFSSYSHFGIHHTMLTDKPRTVSYRDAILKNAASIQGRVVLDVGCGTGILSMFCAQAGASKVIAIDQSDIIYNAMDIVRENGLESKIELIKGRVEEMSISTEKVDIIVSEWMGYFLLFEGMLDAVIAARDKFLNPGGQLLPNKCSIKLVGISDPVSYAENVGFWSDVYGYKMSSLKKELIKEAYVTTSLPESVVTTPVSVLNLDLNTCTVNETNFTSDFTLECQKDCNLTAICGYFDTTFDMPCPVVLSTSPLSEKTHWRQTVFFLPEPIPVSAGLSIPCRICCTKKADDPRALVIDLMLLGQSTTYFLA